LRGEQTIKSGIYEEGEKTATSPKTAREKNWEGAGVGERGEKSA